MKKILLITVIFAVLAGAAFAQSLDLTRGSAKWEGWESPQSQSTAGIFSSWADDFIMPNSFNNVELTNWYGLAGFDSETAAALGFASKIGDIYLALFYNGSFWANNKTFNYHEGQAQWLGNAKDGVRTYDDQIVYSTNDEDPSNLIALLIGLDSMGFRFSFLSKFQSFSIQEDSIANNDEYKSLKIARGLNSPELAWGMTKDIIEGKGIKPYVSFALNFHRDYERYQPYVRRDNRDVAGEERIRHSDNRTVPSLGAGLGGLTIAEKEGFSAAIDLDYLLDIGLYSNDYDYVPDMAAADPKYSIATIKGTWDGASGTELSYGKHLITPSVSGSWEGEKLSLGFRLDLNLGLQSAKYTQYDLEYTTAGTYVGLRKNGGEGSVSVFNFNPVLSLGAQWQLASSFAVNFGGKVDLKAYTNVTNEGKTFYEGAETDGGSYKNVYSGFGGNSGEIDDMIDTLQSQTAPDIAGDIENIFSIGVTISPNDNFAVEATCGVKSGNVLSVFDTYSGDAKTSGLFVFGGVLVSLKF